MNDCKEKKYVVLHVDDDISIRLSIDRFNEFDNEGKILLFDFKEHVMILMPHDEECINKE